MDLDHLLLIDLGVHLDDPGIDVSTSVKLLFDLVDVVAFDLGDNQGFQDSLFQGQKIESNSYQECVIAELMSILKLKELIEKPLF